MKKNNFAKKRKKKGKVRKKKRKNTVDYCCNLQCFGCGETVNLRHGLVYLLMLIWIDTIKMRDELWSLNLIFSNPLLKFLFFFWVAGVEMHKLSQTGLEPVNEGWTLTRSQFCNQPKFGLEWTRRFQARAGSRLA